MSSPALPLRTAPAATAAQTLRFQEKREALLQAAVAVFNERGVKGATLADIAGRVGLVTNSVTYYYRKKEDLAIACVLRALDLHDQLVAEAARQPDVATRVRAYLVGHAQALAAVERGEQPAVMQFNDMLALPSPQAEEAWGRYTDMYRQVRGLLKGPETAGIGRRELNARGHVLLSAALWLRVWLWQYEPDEYADLAAQAADVLLHGVLAGGRWPQEAASPEAGWRLLDVSDAAADAFLRAATALVNEQGYRGASVDKISARLNVTKGSFYHHHDNKEDLITECFERSFSVLRQALRLAAQAEGDGGARAAAAGRALVRFQLSAQGPLLRASATSALPDQAHRDTVRTTLHRLTQRMAGLLVQGVVDGSVRPLDTQMAAQVLVGGINAAAELHRWVPDARVDSAAELYARPLFQGLLVPAG
ncbi:TetR/AcrR family transcriptional regulator [Aquincola tertiaricarbonis]|uniref:TetR/AcrR family transcriptional regulator n=1 Tax=Aquincola tertiaricarbonis TaxID=391953 RepID=A0ABY4S0X2_AQUTE|nr:TetR/AcrR family transcriptional regulator [Aquincola tertiaricarbonis]URI05760.1 TetR/AcrR family transcriptional regulator [Aquincola tertiaricarbonis]